MAGWVSDTNSGTNSEPASGGAHLDDDEGRTARTRSPIAEDEDAQLDTSADLDEIHDLRRQLQEETGEGARYASMTTP